MKKFLYITIVFFIGCSSKKNIENTDILHGLQKKKEIYGFFASQNIKEILLKPDPNEIRKLILNSIDFSKNDTLIFYETINQSINATYESIVFESADNSIYLYSSDNLWCINNIHPEFIKKHNKSIVNQCLIDSVKNNLDNLNKYQISSDFFTGGTYLRILTIAIANENGYTIKSYDKIKIPLDCYSDISDR
jgi:hypothetical protein